MKVGCNVVGGGGSEGDVVVVKIVMEVEKMLALWWM